MKKVIAAVMTTTVTIPALLTAFVVIVTTMTPRCSGLSLKPWKSPFKAL